MQHDYSLTVECLSLPSPWYIGKGSRWGCVYCRDLSYMPGSIYTVSTHPLLEAVPIFHVGSVIEVILQTYSNRELLDVTWWSNAEAGSVYYSPSCSCWSRLEDMAPAAIPAPICIIATTAMNMAYYGKQNYVHHVLTQRHHSGQRLMGWLRYQVEQSDFILSRAEESGERDEQNDDSDGNHDVGAIWVVVTS